LLQAKVAGMDVIHFQGDTTLLHSPCIRIPSLLAAFGVLAAYICQYAVVKTVSNVEAITWVSCQAAAALGRIVFWISHHTFDKSQTALTELALINAAASRTVTFLELICAYDPGEHRIPRWAWDYLRAQDIQEVLRAASRPPSAATVALSSSASWYSFVQADFDIFLDRRRGLDAEEERYNKRFGGRHVWRLGLSRDSSGNITPFILVHVPYSHGMCWMVADRDSAVIEARAGPDGLPPGHIHEICTRLVLSDSGTRLHLRSHRTTKTCDPLCPHVTPHSGDLEVWETFMYVADRSNICDSILEVVNAGAFETRKINNLDEDVWVSATPGTTDRDGRLHTSERDRIFGEKSLSHGLAKVRSYIEQGVREPVKNKKPPPGQTVGNSLV